MKYQLTLCVILLSGFASANQQCQSEHVKATYQITDSANHSKSSHKQFVLLRNKNNTLHINNQKVATKWTKIGETHLKKAAYFIDDKRAIEYEATTSNTTSQWHYHSQLLPLSFQSQANLIEVNEDGCNTLEHYQRTTQSGTIDIWWYPHKNLLKSMVSKMANQSIHWQLNEVVYDKSIIEQQFTQLSHFQSTDFADIGDNESDPFFRKMIRLGFIEHGASGFYDSDGNNLSSTHQH